jgi:arylsulfatase A-like enzyme/tetratricopeptide (TPR) repeat protein
MSKPAAPAVAAPLATPARPVSGPAVAAPLATATLVLLAACGAAPRPNVLLVTLDTTRFDVVGAYGAAGGITPTLDRIASEGVRFDRAYTVTPLTIPAHSSIHTGLLPPRHGVRDNGDFFLGDDATTLAERLHAAGYATMASVGAEVTSHHWGFAQGFDQFFDEMGLADPMGNRWRVERTGDKVSADALGWLDKNATGDKPWFAWVHLFDAHHPYEPPEPYATEFAGHPYQGEVAFADSQVAKLLAVLEAKGVLDHTWVFAVADHGEGLGSHGEGMHGVLLYDATTHVPFLVRPPGGGGGRVVSTPVSLVDLTPTILAATGNPVPAGLDGVDLGPVIRGDSPGDANRAVFAESLYAFHHYGWAPQTALVTNADKLIDSTTPEVYARGDDKERDDLATKEPALLQTLEGQLGGMVTAMAPAGAATRADMSPDRVAQLEALGYLTTSSGAAPTTGLPDPVRQLPVLAKLEKARQALRANDLPKAHAAVDEAIAADPGLSETHVLQATILQREGDLAGAYAVVEALDTAHPGSQTKALMGTIRLQQQRPGDAAVLLGDALAIDPYLAGAWMGYLHALLLSGDPRLGAEAARARTLLPDTDSIGGMLGVALAMQGKTGQAELLLEAALASDPNQPFLNHALGMVDRAKGDVMQAETFFEEEVRLFPPALASRRALVQMYAEQKRYPEQLEQLDAIRPAEAPNPETLHSIAQALFNLKRFDESAKIVQECRTLAPVYAGCALLEANVLKKLGRDAEAQAAYARAVALSKP